MFTYYDVDNAPEKSKPLMEASLKASAWCLTYIKY